MSDAKDNAELNTLHRLREREKADGEFSLGKGMLAGIVGKVAGTAIVTTAQEGIKNKVKNELLHRSDVREALSKAASPAESESIIKGAMKTAISRMEGLRGSMLRNSWSWKAGGGAAAGLGMLSMEYSSHLQNKEKVNENLRDLDRLEQRWAQRIENEHEAGHTPPFSGK